MALYGLKPWYTRRLDIFLKFAVAKNISPDFFTAVGIAGAGIGLLGFIGSLWPLVVLGVLIRLGGANLDGAVARARGVSRPFGFVLNEIGDRLSDLILFAGLILALPSDLQLLGALTAFAASMPTLVSVSGAAVGVPRINGGPFGKTERCLTFCIAAVVINSDPVLVFLLALMLLGSLATTVVRSVRINKELKRAS